ncbi:peptidoglycan endopeptidase [Nocardia panacis]|uniref:Peptidoglycan endopeptidase n=1 Tax=Nocardia panacis TaxID=2340916 RepID=A0A3A4KCQ0_9NOCA|nr:C40 family peptidase [Nocardia panacis]RJO79848.1 peptidoglycan endopeptidase [Nocardia panacis]
MVPGLMGGVDDALRSLLDLYGTGAPAPDPAVGDVGEIVAGLPDPASGPSGYDNRRQEHQSTAQEQSDKQGAVSGAVAESATGTVGGRNALTDQLAEFRSRVGAASALGDPRFSGPALLDAANSSLTAATKQVDADIAAAQQRAAQIMPPAVPAAAPATPPVLPPMAPLAPAMDSERPRRLRHHRGHARRAGHSGMLSDGTTGGQAVEYASAYLGTPYVWAGGGAGGPSGGGFDCSGLTQYAIAQASNGNVVLPRTTYDQVHCGEAVDPRDVRPGDLVFPRTSLNQYGSPEHVQLAAGNGMVIEAPYTGASVRWKEMDSNVIVRRVL